MLASLTRLSRERDLMNDAITSSNSSVMIGIDNQDGDAGTASSEAKGPGLGLATGSGLGEKEDRPRATMDDLQVPFSSPPFFHFHAIFPSSSPQIPFPVPSFPFVHSLPFSPSSLASSQTH